MVRRMLVLAGIDEAGYGPMLGPLCLGASLFVLPDDDPARGAPDLWERLDPAVCRELRDRRGRIAVDDSKRLKGAGKRPLAHLERGVWSFLLAGGREAATTTAAFGGAAAADAPDDPADDLADDLALMRCLGAELPARSWYAGDALPLPSGLDTGTIGLDGGRLARAAEAAGIAEMHVRARAIDAPEFNDGIRRLGSKAGLNLERILQLVEAVRRRHPDAHPRVLVDRQGGRARYAEALHRAWPEASVTVLGETDAVGRYRLSFPDGGPLTISFEQSADERHLPVALASMAAKLVRELLMRRLNRWFAEHDPGLSPTAGYVADARRWLDDAAPLIERLAIERDLLVRRR